VIHQLAQRIAEYLQRELKLGNSRKAIIAYGLEALIGGFVKLISFTAIPLFLGILPQTWAALLASVFFRLPAGGAHCTAYYRCLIASLFTFILVGVFAKQMPDLFPVHFVFFVAYGLAILVTMFWVLADTEAKPVTRASDRKKAKIWAYGVLILYLYLWYRFEIPQDLLLAGSLGLLLQAFTVTSAGYWVMGKLDHFLLIISGPLADKKEVAQ